jgi:CheY-like chemotaxis protein
MCSCTFCASRGEFRPGPTQPLILIVDDDDDLRDALSDFLVVSGYAVETAKDGNRALDRLAIKPAPCMMLLDLMMPIVDGWEVARRLAADLSLPRVPFCVLSACLDDPPAESKYVLNKPFELRELLAIVRHCCGSVPRLGRRAAGPTPTAVAGRTDGIRE